MKGSAFSTYLLAGTALALSMGSTPSMAQGNTAEQASAAGGSGTGQDGSGLADIIVTAQKRTERLQDVPVAVTALAGQALQEANISDTKALSAVVPSLNFTHTASFAQVFIRGVGSRGASGGDEQIVPIYVDGVYQVGMTAGIFKLNSIDRIEVLRGPQGTLFGRNAVGGAINIVTRDPSFKPSAELGLGYGRFNELKGDLYASGPLTDNLAANISLMRHQDDGYARDVLRGTREAASHTTSLRAKLLWEPAENLQAKLTGYFIEAGDAAGVVGFPLNGNTAARRDDPNIFIGRGYRLSNSFSPFADTKSYGGSFDLNYGLGGVDLSALTSYSYFTSDFATDNDATASTIPGSRTNSRFRGIDQHYTFTQEVRASSTGDGPFKWLIGGFFFRDLLKNPLYENAPGLSVTNRGTTHSVAVFGELEYMLTPELSFKVGGRYTEDKRFANTYDILANKRAKEKRKWEDFSSRFTIDYAFAPSQRVYFTYSEAFKSGVIIQPVTTASIDFINVVDPEKLRAYEIGYKGDLSSNFRANIAAYYYDYKDVQVLSQGVLPSGSPFTFLQNAAKEEVYGVDADLTFAPSRYVTMGLAIAWLHARYKDFPNAAVQVPRPDGMGNTGIIVDAAGNKVQRAPDFTAGLNGSYTVPNEVFGGELRFSGNLSYGSGWTFDFIDRLNTGDYVDVNARISWTSADEHYSVALWGTNLANSQRLLSVAETGGADRANLVRPISYGAEMRFKF